ncbi:MAG: hypothetical protein FWE84_05615 [Firmicutes bacterium]|nr:hypothetical protein [Bacillota bacterium]
MTQEINQQKTCENCRYFCQHYSKQKITYEKVFCGHCVYNGVKNYNSRPFKPCRHWETIGDRKERRKESIKKTIEFMSESLKEMALILKDEENDTE